MEVRRDKPGELQPPEDVPEANPYGIRRTIGFAAASGVIGRPPPGDARVGESEQAAVRPTD
jgi:hypothetical protein